MAWLNNGFSTGNSPLHRAEQRTKIVCAVALALVAAMAQSFAGAALSASAGVLLAACARLSPKQVLLALASANGFFVFLLVTLPLTYPGQPWPPLPFLSQDGLHLALLTAFKGNAVMLVVLALLATSTPSALANGLFRLGVPQKLVLLLSFVYRQAALSFQEAERLRLAATMRCFEPSLNARTFKVYASILMQALLRSLDRAERIHQAMLMRGFQGRFHYLLPVVPFKSGDALLLGASLVAALAIFVWDRGWLA